MISLHRYFMTILSCVINCNYPQIIAVKSVIIIKYLFKGLLIK